MPFTFLKKSFLSPLLEFIHDSRAMGIAIVSATVLSLVITNTGWGTDYLSFWNTSFDTGHYLPHSLLHWINDGLMALFFFLAGMEIKRELMIGELSSLKKSIMPVMGALGGMVVPALLFSILNSGTVYSNGWGVPMATDIAFSLGIASLLGKRVPVALKIFLTALAIIDDLGAIVAIAAFYTNEIHLIYLFIGTGIMILLSVWNYLKLPFGIWNFAAGIALWFCFFNSGVHATVAGVLFAFTIPMNRLSDIEHAIHNYVNFLIVPLFVLANTAILIPAGITQQLNTTLSLGIMLGLVIGKPTGILLFCWLTVQLKFGELTKGLNWKHMTGLGLLAGIGFTMSIFIALLAFSDPTIQDISKMAVMLATLLAIILSFVWFKFFTKGTPPETLA